MQLRAKEIEEAADEYRALEAERLDAAAEAVWAKVAAGEERAHEVWLRNRTRFAALNGLGGQYAFKISGAVENGRVFRGHFTAPTGVSPHVVLAPPPGRFLGYLVVKPDPRCKR